MAGFGERKVGKKEKIKLERNRKMHGEDLYKAAISHHAQGDLINAEKRYREAIKIDYYNHSVLINLGVICKNSGREEEAISLYKKAIEISPGEPEAYTNLGNLYHKLCDFDAAISYSNKSLELKANNPQCLMTLGWSYKELGNLEQALASTLKSLELKSDNPDALVNLGVIYKDRGNLDAALASTLRSLELKPDNPNAYINLGGIYKELGDLDQALAYTLKSLELKPGAPKALLRLGSIKMSLGETEEAKKYLLEAVKKDPREYGVYFQLSNMLKTAEEAIELIKSINSSKASKVTPQNRFLIEFAMANCMHKARNYGKASKHLESANKNKLTIFPSNIEAVRQAIASSLSDFAPSEVTNINVNSGKGRIFIVGMPRSGSTLLETILSMNPEIKDLGETRSLEKAIAKSKQHEPCNVGSQTINELYSQIEPINTAQYKYTTDKQLYNFIYINYITTYMPAAKIIHCRRNPMDNILSMYRSNLMAGNNYTASLEDSAKALIAQEQAIRIHKKAHPKKIFTFDYDQFVNAPEANLSKILQWLGLEFNERYLHPERSARSINTASTMQARKPISNESVGGWKNYQNLLKPALRILQTHGIPIK